VFIDSCLNNTKDIAIHVFLNVTKNVVSVIVGKLERKRLPARTRSRWGERNSLGNCRVDSSGSG